MSRAQPRFRRKNLPMPLPVNNVYRIRIYGTIEGQMTCNSFYYRDTKALGTAGAADLISLYTAFTGVGGMLTLYEGAVSVDWAGAKITTECVTSPALAPYVQPNSGVGGGPTGHEPTEVCAVLLRSTVFKGQCGRGHISLPAVPTSWVTASRVTTTTDYDALATACDSSITNAGDVFWPVLFSRNGSAFAAGKQGVGDLQTVKLTTLLGTVRRRKIGRGK